MKKLIKKILITLAVLLVLAIGLNIYRHPESYKYALLKPRTAYLMLKNKGVNIGLYRNTILYRIELIYYLQNHIF